MKRPLVIGLVRFRLRSDARRDLVTRALSARLEELGCNVTSMDESQLTFASNWNPKDEEFEFLRRVSSGSVQLLDRGRDLVIRFRLVERDFLNFLTIALVPVAWGLSDFLKQDAILIWVLALLALLLLMFVAPSESKKCFRNLVARTVDDLPGVDLRQEVA